MSEIQALTPSSKTKMGEVEIRVESSSSEGDVEVDLNGTYSKALLQGDVEVKTILERYKFVNWEEPIEELSLTAREFHLSFNKIIAVDPQTVNEDEESSNKEAAQDQVNRCKIELYFHYLSQFYHAPFQPRSATNR